MSIGYFIQNEYDAFLSDPSTNGTGSSWTRNVKHARRFPTLDAAERECCENERPIAVESFLQPY